MSYLYIAAALFAVYYFRRYWLTPWGVYVSHTETKAGGVFMTVRHVRWYPPFLSFECTYHRFSQKSGERYWWAEEKTGRQVSNLHDTYLTCCHESAVNRIRETEELIAPSAKGSK